jgi:hypothetical protein
MARQRASAETSEDETTEAEADVGLASEAYQQAIEQGYFGDIEDVDATVTASGVEEDDESS